MTVKIFSFAMFMPALLVLQAGCSKSSTPDSNPPANEVVLDGSKYLLGGEPAGAKQVIAARAEAKDGDPIVVVGRIGGSGNPWIEGRAAFWIVDGSLKACSDIPGDMCETPWDYCCETHQLPNATLLVKVLDDSGDIVKAGARALLNVQELSTVVVQGTAQRDDSGNLTLLASGVFVKG